MASRCTRRESPRSCFTATTTCSRPSPWSYGPAPPSSPLFATAIFSGAAPRTTRDRFTFTSKALEALQKTEGKLPINIKVMIEGEEEVGSVSLWDFVKQNRERLKADALVVSDTSMLAKGVPSITYGLRGLDYYQIEITGAGPGSALRSFRRRCAESDHDSGGDHREAAR